MAQFIDSDDGIDVWKTWERPGHVDLWLDEARELLVERVCHLPDANDHEREEATQLARLIREVEYIWFDWRVAAYRRFSGHDPA